VTTPYAAPDLQEHPPAGVPYAGVPPRTTWTCPTCWETVTVTSTGLGPAIIAAIEKRHQHDEENA